MLRRLYERFRAWYGRRKGRKQVEKAETEVVERFGRVPAVGDGVWWAPKGLEGRVVDVRFGAMTFVSGPPCHSPSGKPAAHRYRTVVAFSDTHWDDQLRVWIVGQGRFPKLVRGVLVMPQPLELKVSV